MQFSIMVNLSEFPSNSSNNRVPMNTRKTIQILILSIFFLIFNAITSFAQTSRFPGIVSSLKAEYGVPFQVTGRVKEVSQDKILFQKKSDSHNVNVGQRLWACDHKKGVSPHLQKKIAWVKVEAMFSQTVMASVEQIMERNVQPGDWILNPPSPLVHVYSNINSKHGFPPYQNLIKDLLNAGFQIKEIQRDVLPRGLGDNDLLLRLESSPGHLICRLIQGQKGKLLFYKVMENGVEVTTAFPVDHEIQIQPSQPQKQQSAAAASTGTESPGAVLSAPSTMPRADGQKDIKTSPPSWAKAPIEPGHRENNDFYRLNKAYLKITACDLEGDGISELAMLNEKGVAVFEFSGSGLTEKLSYKFNKNKVFPLNLQAMDIDHDGTDELFVSLAEPADILDKKDSRLCSEILTLSSNTLLPMVQDWPFYLNVISNRAEQRVALAQKKGEFTQYGGAICRITWNANSGQPEISGKYEPAAGVYSIYQFNLLPDDARRIIVLEQNNDLHGYFVPEERVEASGPRNYGEFKEAGYPLKLEQDQYMGGFSDKKTFQTVYAPRRFELMPQYDDQSFLIYKERSTTLLKKIFKSNNGKDQIVGVKWNGNRLVETWKSKKFARDLLDFTFLCTPRQLMVLYRDDEGCVVESLN